jgi:Zn-dependent peptidase ImmA (M78 family)
MAHNANSIEERAADEVLALYWNGRSPVQPFQIARDLGARIVEFDHAPESGYLMVSHGTVEIGVKSTEPEARQRFTVAHELGHWKLGHGNSFRDRPDDFGIGATTFFERQANAFAACLLMPRGLVLELAHLSLKGVDDMARTFKVSRAAMEYRLKNLGLIT